MKTKFYAFILSAEPAELQHTTLLINWIDFEHEKVSVTDNDGRKWFYPFSEVKISQISTLSFEDKQ